MTWRKLGRAGESAEGNLLAKTVQEEIPVDVEGSRDGVQERYDNVRLVA